MAVYEAIRNLVQYGVNTGLLQSRIAFTRRTRFSRSWDWMNMKNHRAHAGRFPLEETLDALLDYAHETGVLKEDGVVYRDLFDTKLMNCLMPRPKRGDWTFLEIV